MKVAMIFTRYHRGSPVLKNGTANALTIAIPVPLTAPGKNAAPMAVAAVVAPVRPEKNAAHPVNASANLPATHALIASAPAEDCRAAARGAGACARMNAGDVFIIIDLMNKILLILGFFILFSTGCNHQRKKELLVYRVNYQCDSLNNCDSSIIKQEHSYFDRHSMVTEYINYHDGYYFIAGHDKNKNLTTRIFYQLNDSFLYANKIFYNDKKQEKKLIYLNSENDTLFIIEYRYNKNNCEKINERKIFSDGSVQEYLYEYDDYNNLLNKCLLKNGQCKNEETHHIVYDSLGRIAADTIICNGQHKVIEKKYRDNKLFYQIEKLSADKPYLKKYYSYDDNDNLVETRNIKIFPGIKSFRLESRVEFMYDKNKNLVNETYFNAEGQKIYSIKREYMF